MLSVPGPAPLDRRRLTGALRLVPFVTDLHVLDEVDSTNDELRRLARAGAPEGTVVVAERQSGGRGRRGRSWHSPPGLGLYVSLLVRGIGPRDRATRWTLAASVAACESCNALGSCDTTIKWPNDVQFGGKKVAGVSAEMRAGGGFEELVLGCGINVGQRPGDFPAELAALATSLRIASGRAIDREALCAEFLGRFGPIRRQLAAGAWDPIAARWQRLAPGAADRPVEVSRDGQVFHGRTRGIDSSGGLRVLSADGALTVVHLVDSVRPL